MGERQGIGTGVTADYIVHLGQKQCGLADEQIPMSGRVTLPNSCGVVEEFKKLSSGWSKVELRCTDELCVLARKLRRNSMEVSLFARQMHCPYIS